MFVSLNGLLGRMKGRKDQVYMVNEFLRHYRMAKKAHAEGDAEMLQLFFHLYVVSEPNDSEKRK